jgi:hypothetical protein
MINNKKNIFFILFSILLINGQTDIAGQINNWKTVIKTILDAAVAVFAIAGGFIVFLQYMQGSEQAQRNFIRFLSGLAIFGLIEAIANFFVATP